MIVALLNQKGGVGKTTLATHIAGELALRGQHVVLLDADPQGSSLDWTQRRSQQGLPRLFGAVSLARETLHQEVPDSSLTVPRHISAPPPATARVSGRWGAKNLDTRVVDFSPLIPLPCCACT